MVVFGPLVLLLISMIVKQNEFEGSLNNHMSVSVPFQMLSKQNAKCINQGISSTNQIKYASVDKINVYKCVKYLVYIYIYVVVFQILEKHYSELVAHPRRWLQHTIWDNLMRD